MVDCSLGNMEAYNESICSQEEQGSRESKQREATTKVEKENIKIKGKKVQGRETKKNHYL